MRRSVAVGAMASMATGLLALRKALGQSTDGYRGFIKRAFAMRRRAVSEGDQAYGAIVVKTVGSSGLGHHAW